MSAANQLPYLMTVAEFLDWPTPDGSDRWELVDGAPEAMAPSRPRHGLIASETNRLLASHLVDHPRCRVLTEASVQPDGYNFRIPDLSVTCETINADDLLLREPVLIVEILSPSNAHDTRGAVLRYMTIPSAHEILVLHSVEIRAELLRRSPDPPWPQMTLASDDTVTLESIGFSAPLASFYRTATAA
jgi:Uma2 family endonuclease